MIFSLGSALPITPIAATSAMAVACAALSVFVVARRWAFIGEGISHSGFGGAGLAWLLALLIPPLRNLPWVSYAAVVIFCLATAIAIGYINRGSRVAGDAAIGIFLVASLGFGFLAREIYRHFNNGIDPVDFSALLTGDLGVVSPTTAVLAVIISAAVLFTLFALGKEILSYCFDPLMAEASGVPSGFIHYLLMILLAIMIIVGIWVMGAPLMTALLVLPGVTATLLSQRLQTVLKLSIATALISAILGVALNSLWRFIPIGPAVVLILFVEFLAAYAAGRWIVRR
jgi:ABC-type Mn2+/Zn2+ transport system permease subunit